VAERPWRLVVAIGSRRGDDVAGPLVADLLRAAAPKLDVVELSGDLTRLLDVLDGVSEAVLVDSVRGAGEPGTIHRIDTAQTPLPVGLSGTSTHGIGIGDTIALGQALGRLPPRLHFYGIVGGRWADGDEPTPAVRQAAARVAAEILAGEEPGGHDPAAG
jgi:hydrogenase maturation protease